MAFKLSDVGGYGTGALGDVTNPSGQINSYANVTAYTASTITIGTPSVGIYETFAVEKEIGIHVSAGNGTSTDTTYLGAKLHCKITAVNGSVLTIDKDFTAVLPTAAFANYQVQAVTVAQFNKLTLSSGSITPPAYSTTNKYGGILLAKCADTVTFRGGSINLVDKGIPVASTAYRPKTAQELQGTADTDQYSGWENHITSRKFLLNCGDGAAQIIAKHYVQSGTTSRIGGTTAGVQFARGTVGGSTIAIIAGDMIGFDPSIISKTKGSGQGLGRCYIASSTKLRNDEGLYAYDCISYPSRLGGNINIKGYGDGSLGAFTNPTISPNNYAKITGISADGRTINYTNKTTNGIAQISTGSLIMFHVSDPASSSDVGLIGKFMLAKVLSDDGVGSIVLDAPVTKIFDPAKIGAYSCQLVSVAQFTNLTISREYTSITPFSKLTGTGGVWAIACTGTFDLTNGVIADKRSGYFNTLGNAYGREGLAFIGNAQMSDILPLGQGRSSFFILAKNMIGNSASRIGSDADGSLVGAYVGSATGGAGSGAGGGLGTVGNNSDYSGTPLCDGGYGGKNGQTSAYGGDQFYTPTSVAGAHIFAVVDTLQNFKMSMFSTGGMPGFNCYTFPVSPPYNLVSSGAGYGGAAYKSGGPALPGYSGGSGGCKGTDNYLRTAGGASGWCFLYCNNVVNMDTTGVVI